MDCVGPSKMEWWIPMCRRRINSRWWCWHGGWWACPRSFILYPDNGPLGKYEAPRSSEGRCKAAWTTRCCSRDNPLMASTMALTPSTGWDTGAKDASFSIWILTSLQQVTGAEGFNAKSVLPISAVIRVTLAMYSPTNGLPWHPQISYH